MPDLIKKFFDTFEIKAKELEYPDNFTYYPEITDRILLEMICILNENATLDETYYQGASTVKELKKRC